MKTRILQIISREDHIVCKTIMSRKISKPEVIPKRKRMILKSNSVIQFLEVWELRDRKFMRFHLIREMQRYCLQIGS